MHRIQVDLVGGMVAGVNGIPEGIEIEIRDYDVPETEGAPEGESWPTDENDDEYASFVFAAKAGTK